MFSLTTKNAKCLRVRGLSSGQPKSAISRQARGETSDTDLVFLVVRKTFTEECSYKYPLP